MITTTVLIVGAGPAGLAMAALLGRFGVDCVVVERRAGVNPHPRARSVNVRTAEIFRQWGILDQIVAASLPTEWTSSLVYTETLAGREIGRTAMSVQPVVDGVELSPAPWLLSSQDQIEPVIARFAEDQGCVRLLWDSQLVALDVTDHRVTAAVRSRATTTTVEAAWVVAADGASSTVRQALGIEMVGDTGLATLVNCHFRADLGPWTDHRPAALYWTTRPARNVFQKIDTRDRWLCQIGYDPREHRPEDFDRSTAATWIRRSIGGDDPDSNGVSNLDIDVLDVIPWVMSSTVAARFRHGRAFLVGDAAHQLPPSGGFGMNTAIQDAHNLAWKLAFVERGWASPALLDTYEQERAPVARYNGERSLDNTRNVGRIRRIVESGNGDPGAEADAIAAAGRYGNWLGMDLGLRYDAGCLIPDGTAAPVVGDPVSDYHPTARPGHRAPHLPMLGPTPSASPSAGTPHTVAPNTRYSDAQSPDTQTLLDLYDRTFVLLTGHEVAAERVATQAGVVVFPLPAGDAGRVHGIAGTGAVLVRPDGHVAWRRAEGFAPHEATAVVSQLLGR